MLLRHPCRQRIWVEITIGDSACAPMWWELVVLRQEICWLHPGGNEPFGSSPLVNSPGRTEPHEIKQRKVKWCKPYSSTHYFPILHALPHVWFPSSVTFCLVKVPTTSLALARAGSGERCCGFYMTYTSWHHCNCPDMGTALVLSHSLCRCLSLGVGCPWQ